MIYCPVGRAFEVRMGKITGGKVRCWWYDPRTGEAQEIGTFPNTGTRKFRSPDKGDGLDWILVLDDAAKKYPPPGSGSRRPKRAG